MQPDEIKENLLPSFWDPHSVILAPLPIDQDPIAFPGELEAHIAQDDGWVNGWLDGWIYTFS